MLIPPEDFWPSVLFETLRDLRTNENFDISDIMGDKGMSSVSFSGALLLHTVNGKGVLGKVFFFLA